MESREIDPVAYKAMLEFCARGDELAEEERYDEALAEYAQAWMLVPRPPHEWNAATWILTAVADACFLAGRTEEARDALDSVMECPGAIGSPFLHLRRGQVLFDQGELEGAADELMRAYMGGAAEIFEPEDPKYFAFLKTLAKGL